MRVVGGKVFGGDEGSWRKDGFVVGRDHEDVVGERNVVKKVLREREMLCDREERERVRLRGGEVLVYI